MARRPLFPLYDRILDGQLAAILTGWRAEGTSYEEMAGRLRDEHQIIVTSETVRRWCSQLGIELGPTDEAVGL